MKPYSLDLRQKILDAYDHKRGSQRTVAALFGVSCAFLEQLLRRRRTIGEIAPRPHAGGRQPCYDPTALAMELCLSKVKTALRAAKARTRIALDATLQQVMKTVTAIDSQNWFRHCGYAL